MWFGCMPSMYVCMYGWMYANRRGYDTSMKWEPVKDQAKQGGRVASLYFFFLFFWRLRLRLARPPRALFSWAGPGLGAAHHWPPGWSRDARAGWMRLPGVVSAAAPLSSPAAGQAET